MPRPYRRRTWPQAVPPAVRPRTAWLIRHAHRLDRAAFDAVATAHLPGLEYVLPRLSRVADNGVLWFGTAAVLAATRRVALRRAGVRGSVALCMASPLVNVFGKHAFRRKRPLVDLVPRVRIRWQLPTSHAFPSGHSASAAAFATGVALEAPRRVAVPIAVLAGTVAFSRVYNGAHYPGDVLGGVAIGIGAGFVTRVLWTSHPPVAEPGPPVPNRIFRRFAQNRNGIAPHRASGIQMRGGSAPRRAAHALAVRRGLPPGRRVRPSMRLDEARPGREGRERCTQA